MFKHMLGINRFYSTRSKRQSTAAVPEMDIWTCEHVQIDPTRCGSTSATDIDPTSLHLGKPVARRVRIQASLHRNFQLGCYLAGNGWRQSLSEGPRQHSNYAASDVSNLHGLFQLLRRATATHLNAFRPCGAGGGAVSHALRPEPNHAGQYSVRA